MSRDIILHKCLSCNLEWRNRSRYGRCLRCGAFHVERHYLTEEMTDTMPPATPASTAKPEQLQALRAQLLALETARRIAEDDGYLRTMPAIFLQSIEALKQRVAEWEFLNERGWKRSDSPGLCYTAPDGAAITEAKIAYGHGNLVVVYGYAFASPEAQLLACSPTIEGIFAQAAAILDAAEEVRKV